MQKKLTITIDERVHASLYEVVGPGKISAFIEHLLKSHLVPAALDEAYARMAADTEREFEADEWVSALENDGAR